MEALAVPNVSASWVTKFLETYIFRHGVPAKVITDHGSAFTSNEFAETLIKHCIEHSMISAGHPQANGLCEKTNKPLIERLAACVGEKHEDWDSVLEQAVSCLNRAYHETTKLTPFELVYGRRPVNSKNAILPRSLVSDGGPTVNADFEKLRKNSGKDASSSVETSQIFQ